MLIAGRIDRLTIILVAAFFVAVAAAAAMSDFDAVLAAMGSLGIVSVCWVLGLSLVNYLLRAFRWQRFSDHLGLAMPPIASMRIFLAGLAMGATPARAGEAIRLWMMRKQFGIRYREGGALMLADRASDLNALGLLAAIGLSLTLHRPYLLVGVVIVLLLANLLAARPAVVSASIGCLYRICRPRFRRPLAAVRRMLRRLATTYRPRILLVSAILGCVAWMAEGLAFGIVLESMGAGVPLSTAVGIYSIASIVGAASTLPGGLGGFEGACITMLVSQGVPTPIAVAATAAIRLGTLWFSIVLGFVFLPESLRQASVARHGSVRQA